MRLIFLQLLLCFGACAYASARMDLTLEKAEELALSSNKGLLELEELVKAAEQGRLEAFSKWFPRLELISQGYETETMQFLTGSKSSYVTQLQLSQAVFNADDFYDVKLASLALEHLKLLLAAARNDTLLAVRNAYFRIVFDMDSVRTREEHVELLTALSRQTRDNFARGTAIIHNVNQSKVAAANATARLYVAKKNLRVDLDRMSEILGILPGDFELGVGNAIPVEEIPEIEVKLSELEEVFAESGTATDAMLYAADYPQSQIERMRGILTNHEMRFWENLALSNRPRMLDEKNALRIAKERVQKATGEYFPKLALLFNYGGGETPFYFDPSSKFTNQKFDWSVGFKLNWLAFDGLGRERRIKRAKYQKRAAEYKLEQATLTTVKQVRGALFSIDESLSSYLTACGIEKLARQSLEVASDQLEIGTITVYDYQIAIDSLIESENIKNSARFDLISAYFGLRHASGIDIDPKNGYEKADYSSP